MASQEEMAELDGWNEQFPFAPGSPNLLSGVPSCIVDEDINCCKLGKDLFNPPGNLILPCHISRDGQDVRPDILDLLDFDVTYSRNKILQNTYPFHFNLNHVSFFQRSDP
jgi:hypothetical protein